jgi:hypothetical protein
MTLAPQPSRSCLVRTSFPICQERRTISRPEKFLVYLTNCTFSISANSRSPVRN